MEIMSWEWWVKSEAGLGVRVLIGVGILVGLAIWDLKRNGERATRWKEYLLLLTMVGAALVYGTINDQITATISWEYFYYGKELGVVLGEKTPPEGWGFRWEVAKVGWKATWTAALVMGVVILLANNPWRGWRRVSYRRVYGMMGWMVAGPVVGAVVLGWAGYRGWMVNWVEDFGTLVRFGMWRPERYMCVYGVHLGGYLGGLAAMVWGVGWIVRERKRGDR